MAISACVEPVRATNDDEPYFPTEGHSVLSRAVHKSGKKRYVELSFAILVDKAGKTLGALATA